LNNIILETAIARAASELQASAIASASIGQPDDAPDHSSLGMDPELAGIARRAMAAHALAKMEAAEID
jgi:hypothetical protein